MDLSGSSEMVEMFPGGSLPLPDDNWFLIGANS